MSNFDEYIHQVDSVIYWLNHPTTKEKYNKMVNVLYNVKERKGRCFIAGMGGSAANAQHMANDFRKIAGIDAISLSDNIAELTARANDDGLTTIYSNTMKVSNFEWKDILFILSVSGGSREKDASMALVKACEYAKDQGGTVLGIVGMPDSETERMGDVVIVTPQPSKYLTQIAESLQAVIWHGIISDPQLLENAAKW